MAQDESEPSPITLGGFQNQGAVTLGYRFADIKGYQPQFLQQLFAEFHLAKPAYVLAVTLLLGFIIGFSEPPGTTANDADGAQVQSFLYADESIL